MKSVILLVTALALSGCALIAPKVGPQVAKAINRYCQEPLSERLVLRESVNSQIAPNSVKVTCSGDPQ
jgi:hypothetical protein